MQKFLIALAAAGLILGNPVKAGLGEAETRTQQSYDAYCGEVGNNCKVVFSSNRLTVNFVDGITREQFEGYSERDGQIYDFFGSSKGTPTTFFASYNENGAIKTGEFIFVNQDTAKNFRSSLEALAVKVSLEK